MNQLIQLYWHYRCLLGLHDTPQLIGWTNQRTIGQCLRCGRKGLLDQKGNLL